MSKERIEKYERLYAAIEAFNDKLPKEYENEFRAVTELFGEYVQQIANDNQDVLNQIKGIALDIKKKTGIDIGDVLDS